VLRQVGLPQQLIALGLANARELQGDAEFAVQAVFRPEQGLDGAVEVQAAGLELGADEVVDPAGHLMFDLVPDLDQELQVGLGGVVERARLGAQAMLQLPMFVSAVAGFEDVPRLVVAVAIVDVGALEMRMHQVGPGNHRGNDKHL
jgi:hypothetical protein